MILGWAPLQTFSKSCMLGPWMDVTLQKHPRSLHKRDWRMGLKDATLFMRKACL